MVKHNESERFFREAMGENDKLRVERDALRAAGQQLAEALRWCSGTFDFEAPGWQRSAESALAAWDAIETKADRGGGMIDLRAALRGLSQGATCFCEVAIGNPNMRGRHSQACVNARQALGE